MQISNDPNVWVIYGLVLVLGILIGLFMTSGGRKKWKTRYYDEVDRHKATERTHAEVVKQHERDLAAARTAPVVAAAPVAATAAAPRKAGVIDRMLGRDRDHDGIDDRTEGRVDRDGDGIDDRTEGRIDRDGDGVDDRVDRRPDNPTKA